MPELEANGIRLGYDVEGEGPPLVMVAGRGMPREWWSEQHTRPYLDSGFSVLRFDNRGMPPSECPPEPYAVSDLVADAAALVDALELGPSVVVGHSMGSCIAQELGAARPDLVRAVAMIATTARHPGWVRVFHRGMLELFESGAEVPPLAREVAEAIPDCRYVELPRAGHWAVVLDPARVHGIVIEFLREAGVAPAG